MNEYHSVQNPWEENCTCGAKRNETKLVKHDLFYLRAKYSHTFMRNKFHIINNFNSKDENLQFLGKLNFRRPFKAYWSRDAQTGLTFNNCTFCPHCIYVFCIYLRTNSDLCHLQHKLIGFYNRDEKCLQRGTDWVFK